jgi:hypothetical protein
MRNSNRIAWLLFFVALAFCFQRCDAQEMPTICGTNLKSPQTAVDLIQIACVDFDALRKVAPGVPWPIKPQTQVLIHAAGPGAVRVTVRRAGGETEFSYSQEQWAELVPDGYGRWAAMLIFDGLGYTGYAVKAFGALE